MIAQDLGGCTGKTSDFIVEDKVLIEMKAISEITDAHYAQSLNYLKIYRLEVGLLINFGSKSLTFKRLAYTSKT
jgi:GxxExxY protein